MYSLFHGLLLQHRVLSNFLLLELDLELDLDLDLEPGSSLLSLCVWSGGRFFLQVNSL